MIIDEIKKESMMALKNRDETKRNILGMVISKIKLVEIGMREKGGVICEADVVQILQKTVKELVEEAQNFEKAGNTEMKNEVDLQQKIVSSFLPQMLSIAEIKAEIEKLPDATIPTVMKHFKANFAGKVNMADVQKVAKKEV